MAQDASNHRRDRRALGVMYASPLTSFRPRVPRGDREGALIAEFWGMSSIHRSNRGQAAAHQSDRSRLFGELQRFLELLRYGAEVEAQIGRCRHIQRR